LASKDRLPTMYWARHYTDEGGLMSYGPNFGDLMRRSAGYVDKILKGAKPGDLPIEQPTKFELVVNLKTAKALGLTIPESILLRADEVIRGGENPSQLGYSWLRLPLDWGRAPHLLRLTRHLYPVSL